MRSGFGVVERGGRARRRWLIGLALASIAACGGDDASAAAESPGRNDAEARKVAAAAASDGPERRAAARATGRGRVLFVGTSLTAGLGLDPSEAYPAIVASMIDSAGFPFEVVNAG